MRKVSVIVPVYNVEKYINRCVDSLIKQTLEDIEIILVDDGSFDKSGAICEEYAKKDARIKVVHKKNEGLGYARNTGLELASAEFAAFVDSDDFAAPDMFEKLYTGARENEADSCICGLMRVSNKGTEKEYLNPLGKNLFKDEEVINEILINMLGSQPEYDSDDYLWMSVCKGIYSNSIIKNNGLKFHSEKEFISEDIIFNFDYFLKSSKVATIPDALYYYCENSCSLTKSYKLERFEKDKILYFELLNRIKQLGIEDKAKLRIDRTLIARSRICIIHEVINAEKTGIKEAKKNINFICSDKDLQKVLKDYPVSKLPAKQMAFSLCTRFKMTYMLFLLVKLNYLKGARK